MTVVPTCDHPFNWASILSARKSTEIKHKIHVFPALVLAQELKLWEVEDLC